MKIQTERLESALLTAHQLKLWIEDIPALNKKWNCSYKAKPMEGVFLEIVKGQLQVTENDSEQYLWHSFWFLIQKADRVVVGLGDFKEIPNAVKEVEIGYGLGKTFEHNSYMIGAVQAVYDWGMNQEAMSFIIAETNTGGFASQRVLQRCGFAEEKCGDIIRSSI